MIKQTRSANIVRGYAWWLLKNNLEWDESDYNGAVPIVPYSDEPRLQTFEKPYLVYGFIENVNGKDTRIIDGIITFSIRSKNLSDISLASRILIEGFKRRDDSAKDINKYSSDIDPYFDGMNFLYTNMNYSQPGSPEKTNQGRMEGIVSISYCYVDQFSDDPENGGVLLRTETFTA